MSKLFNPASIGQIVNAVTNERDVELGLRNLLRGVTQLFGADHAAIYRLYLNRSRYVLELGYLPEKDEFVSNQPTLDLHVSDLVNKELGNKSLLAKAISTLSIIFVTPGLVDQLPYMSVQSSFTVLIPIVRGQSCLGVIRLDSSSVTFADTISPFDIELVRAFILTLFERQSSLLLLKALQKPIDFTQSLNGLLDDILLLIAEASRMPFIQIHESDAEQSLHCVALYGLKGEMREFDLEPVEAYGSFDAALTRSVTVVEPTMDIVRLTAIRQRAEFRDLKSFVVVPLTVGTQLFGTVLFGAGCPFDYSPLEVAGFESFASSIGNAITNSRNAQQLRDLFIADVRTGLAISGLEVAQAARHEVRGTVEDCIASLATIRYYLRKHNLIEAEKGLEKVGDRLTSISVAMDKIKAASQAPDDHLQLMSLTEIWRQAFSLVSAQLEQEGIQVRVAHIGKEKDICIEILSDSLRHAFLQLLINSIDAFKARRKGERLITVMIDPQSEAAVDIRIRYTDNASGMDPTQFRQWVDGDHLTDIKKLVFDKGVTTKPSGSGYGLYLVRIILARHHGSVELTNYRGGVVFDITLPKDLRAKTERL